jgi:hypothetical protein
MTRRRAIALLAGAASVALTGFHAGLGSNEMAAVTTTAFHQFPQFGGKVADAESGLAAVDPIVDIDDSVQDASPVFDT